MGRRNDPLWRYVERLNNNHFKCKFCKCEYAGGASRIKSHLSNVEGRGIKICTEVPKCVRREANRAIRRPSQKCKTVLSSISNDEETNTICSQSLSEEVGSQARYEDPAAMEVQLPEQVEERRTSSQAEEGNEGENNTGEPMCVVDAGGDEETNAICSQNPNDEVGSQARYGVSTAMEVQILEQDVEERRTSLAEEENDGENHTGEPMSVADTRRDLLKLKLLGQAFQRNMDEIWTSLTKNDVLTIGLYGMAGVGKTALARQIRRKLIQHPDKFSHVYWVTLSPGFDNHKLQSAIAKAMHLDISNEDDEGERAEKLAEALMKNKKSVLILDNAWKHIPFEEVGIPVCKNGCKLVITTRSLDVCQMTGCQENFKIMPLTKEEGWDLFLEKLGRGIKLPPEVEEIAQSVANEFAGLPLGIITMAISMRGSTDICEWRNALEELQGSILRQDIMEVFEKLQLSYDYLKDSALQQCFLYCALFPKDSEIEREELIEYLIVEGVIKRMKSRQAQFDKGHKMLNKLENVCLLESVGDISKKGVKMHGLIRDMALQILSSTVMVAADEQLEELPDEEKWTKNLLRVSLMLNDLKEVASSHSPRCPNLSTLLLCANESLEFIADSFFEQLHGLKVLDLSYTAIRELPGSISNLVSLTALLLRGCDMLTYVPSLAKLLVLQKLDLNSSGVKEVPEGMELLSGLYYLDLYCPNLKVLPSGILPKLSQLHFLRLHPSMTVKEEELVCLKKLETLHCHFYHLHDFTRYAYSLEMHHKLSKYSVLIGQDQVRLHNCSISREGDFVAVPHDIEELRIKNCHDAKSLCDIPPLRYATKLKAITIEHCDGIEFLFPSPSRIPERLEALHLASLKNLILLHCRDEVHPPPLPSNHFFCCLKKLVITECSSIKKLFFPSLLPNLQNLEVIEVKHCLQMEEVIAEEERQEEMIPGARSSIQINLPKLRLLYLFDLPELRSICSGKMVCSFLLQIIAGQCPKLNRTRLSLDLLYSSQS